MRSVGRHDLTNPASCGRRRARRHQTTGADDRRCHGPRGFPGRDDAEGTAGRRTMSEAALEQTRRIDGCQGRVDHGAQMHP